MKKAALFILLVSSILTHAQSDTPQKVYSFAQRQMDYSWYKTQYELWEKEANRKKKNENAWLNLYEAARLAKRTSPDETTKNQWENTLMAMLPKMKSSVPQSYAYNYAQADRSDLWLVKTQKEVQEFAVYAEKAYQLNSEKTEIYSHLANVFLISGNSDRFRPVAKKWKESGELSSNLLAINYNILIGTDANAILLTAGDNDTYPALILQLIDQVRTDVTILNIHCLAASELYRNRLFKQLGIPTLNGNKLEEEKVIQHVIDHKGKRPLHATYCNAIFESESLNEVFYNTGVALQYSATPFDNTSVTLHNFEHKFMLDHLKINIFPDRFPKTSKQMNSFYVSGLITLYKHYHTLENETKTTEIENWIHDIVAGMPYESWYKEKLDEIKKLN